MTGVQTCASDLGRPDQHLHRLDAPAGGRVRRAREDDRQDRPRHRVRRGRPGARRPDRGGRQALDVRVEPAVKEFVGFEKEQFYYFLFYK